MWHSPYCFIVIIDYNHKVFNRILANTLILVLFYVVPARERFIQESRNDTVAWMKAEPAPASSSPSSSDLKLPYLLVQVLKQSLKKSGNFDFRILCIILENCIGLALHLQRTYILLNSLVAYWFLDFFHTEI